MYHFSHINSIAMGSHLCPAVIVTFSAGRGTEDTLEAVKIFVSDSWKIKKKGKIIQKWEQPLSTPSKAHKRLRQTATERFKKLSV